MCTSIIEITRAEGMAGGARFGRALGEDRRAPVMEATAMPAESARSLRCAIYTRKSTGPNTTWRRSALRR